MDHKIKIQECGKGICKEEGGLWGRSQIKEGKGLNNYDTLGMKLSKNKCN